MLNACAHVYVHSCSHARAYRCNGQAHAVTHSALSLTAGPIGSLHPTITFEPVSTGHVPSPCCPVHASSASSMYGQLDAFASDCVSFVGCGGWVAQCGGCRCPPRACGDHNPWSPSSTSCLATSSLSSNSPRSCVSESRADSRVCTRGSWPCTPLHGPCSFSYSAVRSMDRELRQRHDAIASRTGAHSCARTASP